MSRSWRFASGAALLSLIALACLPVAPAAADDYDTCLGSTADALDACTRVIVAPGSTREQVGEAYIGRGQHHYEKDEYDLAIADFNRAMPLKPKWLQLAYGNRGNAYLMKGDNDQALDSYDQAITIDANYTAAYTGRGLIYEKLGLIEKARADFQAALNAHSPFHDEDWGKDTARKHLARLQDK
jgi:tetratricopeptide (TPR) repeat protein